MHVGSRKKVAPYRRTVLITSLRFLPLCEHTLNLESVRYSESNMEDLDPTAIRALVENLMEAPCHFILNTDRAPFCGGEYAIYALEDEEKSRRLCLRIPHN